MKQISRIILVSLSIALSSTGLSCSSPSPLNNTSWYAVEADNVTMTDLYISISFYNDELEGYDGCNRYTAGFSTSEPDNFSADLQEMIITTQGCVEPEYVKKQRSRYFQALGKATCYSIAERTLTLFNTSRQPILVFNRRQVYLLDLNDLIGTSWQLKSINDTPVPKDAGVSILFETSTEASGNAGNFSYLLDYQAEGNILRWMIQTVREGETSESIERLALEYLDAINTGTHQLNRIQNILELFTQNGTVLIYEQVLD